MFQFVQNRLCVSYSLLVDGGYMKANNYKYHRKAGNIEVMNRASLGNPTQIDYESLPAMVKSAIIEKMGNPYELARKQPLLHLIATDNEARKFFTNYRLEDGRPLPNGLDAHGNYNPDNDYIGRYVRQAEWFNMMRMALSDKHMLKDMLHVDSVADFYEVVIKMHQEDRPMNPSLPTSRERLTKRYKKYLNEGYDGLIDGHFGNNRARKVNDKIENLILALYCHRSNPYMAEVVRMYAEFMAGSMTVVDLDSGEMFDPKDFYVKGKPYELTRSTVKHYLSKPENELVAKKYRVSDYEFRMTVRPHHLRKAPIYALSKITMDDTSSPFKMHDGKRPATYKVFDVASQALIAIAMTKDERPNAELVRQCLRNMLRTIVQNGWGMPHQIEVENAINKSMVSKKDEQGNKVADVLAAGAMFHTVYFCAPKNPQEKAAEGFIRTIKYTYQKHREGFQARPFARLDANRMNEDADKVRYEFEQIQRMEEEDAHAYNHALHPNQDLYPGKTRWQVLVENQNPELPPPVLPVIIPFVGQKVPHTKISRGYLTVKGTKMQLPTGALAAQLADETVTAYYLPEADGAINKAYLYMDAEFVCEALPVARYNSSMLESTQDDYAIRAQQQQYISEFDEALQAKRDKLPTVGVVRTAIAQQIATESAEATALPQEATAVQDDETNNYQEPDNLDDLVRSMI